jgi:hypothetical protein
LLYYYSRSLAGGIFNRLTRSDSLTPCHIWSRVFSPSLLVQLTLSL